MTVIYRFDCTNKKMRCDWLTNIENRNVYKSYYKKYGSRVLTNYIYIDAEAKVITKKLNIDDRVEATATKEVFTTLKDHKDNFVNKPTYRLKNPSKQEIGRISKQSLEKIIRKTCRRHKRKPVEEYVHRASMVQEVTE